MIKKFGWLILIVGLITSGNVFADPVEALIEDGFTIREQAINAGGGFDYLNNGDGIVISYDFVSTPTISIIDLNGDGLPATPQVVGYISDGSFGSFIKVSLDGNFAIYGVTGSVNEIIKLNFSDYSQEVLTEVIGNYGLAFASNHEVYISANASFDPTVPNQILAIDLNHPDEHIEVAQISGTPSGPIETNSTGDLYYIKSTWIFPAPPLSHQLLKYDSSQLKAAKENNLPLSELQAKVIAQMDTGFNIAINAFNDIFISGLNGIIYRVREIDGSVSVFTSTLTPPNDGSFSHLAFSDVNWTFDPFYQNDSVLGVAYANSYFTEFFVLEFKSADDDAFADKVLSLLPGTGGSPANQDRVLGFPVGGGTSFPENSSIVMLGDRDNPDETTPAYVSVKFNQAIRDDAQNLFGSDLIVFSNAFFSGGNERSRFSEPALVEVSQDFNHNGEADDEWFLILPNTLPDDLGPYSPAVYGTMTLRNYAEFSPTLKLGDLDGDNIVDDETISPDEFFTIPDGLSFEGDNDSYLVDQGSGGGDAMDIQSAVRQTSAGEPLIDAFGRYQYVSLDEVDFVRVRDVRKDDFHPGAAGRVTAEIDAVSDARPNIHGEQIDISTVNDLLNALGNAQEGDVIQLVAGEYVLSNPIILPLGVSLKGTSGLWTVNDDSDDVIIRGDKLTENQSCVSMIDGNADVQLNQGVSITGIHFDHCPTAIDVSGVSLTIEQNMFIGTVTAVNISNRSQDKSYIRKNIFGHHYSVSPMVGVMADDVNLMLTHNTFVGTENSAVLLTGNSQAYFRNNIFAKNEIAIDATNSDFVSGEYNVFHGNQQDYLLNEGGFTSDIHDEPQFALSANGDYRLSVTSSVRQSALGGADPGVYDGPHFYPFDISSGYYLNLNQFPFIQSLDNGIDSVEKYSAAAVAQMWLTYLWWNKIDNPDGPPELEEPLNDQQYLYDEGHSFNFTMNGDIDRLDLSGLWHTVQTLDPPYNPYHYNFGKRYRSDVQTALGDICYWLAYPAGGGVDNPRGDGVDGYPVHVPAAIPLGGNYDQWVAVRGVRTTENPFEHDDFSIFGFWINDPNPSGLGQNSYKTAEQLANEYYLPMTDVNPDDPVYGKWVNILEPSISGKRTAISVAENRLERPIQSKSNPQVMTVDKLQKTIYASDISRKDVKAIQLAAHQALLEEFLPYDSDFSKIYPSLRMGKPYLVHNQSDHYYLVPLETKKRGTSKASASKNTLGVIVLSAQGKFLEISWLNDPAVYLPVSRQQALTLVLKKMISEKVAELGRNKPAKFWRFSRYNRFLVQKFRKRLLNGARIELNKGRDWYYPQWKITVDGNCYIVDQAGKLVD